MTLVHASCVAIGGRAMLIAGPSGAGKSDLALRLIDRGATLVSDDYTSLRVEDGRLIASAPELIAGKLEVRGLGILDVYRLVEAPVALWIDLAPPERLPAPATHGIAGVTLPAVRLAPLEPSAPIKAEWALERAGVAS